MAQRAAFSIESIIEDMDQQHPQIIAKYDQKIAEMDAAFLKGAALNKAKRETVRMAIESVRNEIQELSATLRKITDEKDLDEKLNIISELPHRHRHENRELANQRVLRQERARIEKSRDELQAKYERTKKVLNMAQDKKATLSPTEIAKLNLMDPLVWYGNRYVRP
jgi:hypothetical protein